LAIGHAVSVLGQTSCGSEDVETCAASAVERSRRTRRSKCCRRRTSRRIRFASGEAAAALHIALLLHEPDAHSVPSPPVLPTSQ
jgi:hypothetical protein